MVEIRRSGRGSGWRKRRNCGAIAKRLRRGILRCAQDDDRSVRSKERPDTESAPTNWRPAGRCQSRTGSDSTREPESCTDCPVTASRSRPDRRTGADRSSGSGQRRATRSCRYTAPCRRLVAQPCRWDRHPEVPRPPRRVPVTEGGSASHRPPGSPGSRLAGNTAM